jgi:hypothetical protein
MAAKKDSYKEWLKEDFGKIFEILKLGEVQTHFLRSRWLYQVLWMESKAAQARNRYYTLKAIAIIGGVSLPTLITLNNSALPEIKQYFYGFTFILSLLVSATFSIEGFFLYGDQWRNYRRSVESLKTHGWKYFQLSGPYLPYKSHEEAFPTFVDQVEGIIQQDLEVTVGNKGIIKTCVELVLSVVEELSQNIIAGSLRLIHGNLAKVYGIDFKITWPSRLRK